MLYKELAPKGLFLKPPKAKPTNIKTEFSIVEFRQEYSSYREALEKVASESRDETSPQFQAAIKEVKKLESRRVVLDAALRKLCRASIHAYPFIEHWLAYRSYLLRSDMDYTIRAFMRGGIGTDKLKIGKFISVLFSEIVSLNTPEQYVAGITELIWTAKRFRNQGLATKLYNDYCAELKKQNGICTYEIHSDPNVMTKGDLEEDKPSGITPEERIAIKKHLNLEKLDCPIFNPGESGELPYLSYQMAFIPIDMPYIGQHKRLPGSVVYELWKEFYKRYPPFVTREPLEGLRNRMTGEVDGKAPREIRDAILNLEQEYGLDAVSASDVYEAIQRSRTGRIKPERVFDDDMANIVMQGICLNDVNVIPVDRKRSCADLLKTANEELQACQDRPGGETLKGKEAEGKRLVFELARKLEA